MTGRDGAIDFAEKSEAMEPSADPANDAARFVQALGRPWSRPGPIFPRMTRNECSNAPWSWVIMANATKMLREQLAKFLHDRHKRTTEARVDREESSGR